jgi:AmmeMemoRadiSam system protein B
MDRPRLRAHLGAAPEDGSGSTFLIHDLLRLSDALLRVSPLELEWVQLFDGRRTLRDIQAEAMRMLDGRLLPLELFAGLAEQLDRALFLDTPRFREAAAAPVRRPVCLGAYEADPDDLRQQLGQLFAHPDGAGPPGPPRPDGRLRAVLVPHIDYARGGLSYTHAFKEVFERTDAALFVIIGTSHYSRHRFTLTRKHFQTPLGTVRTDQGFIDRLVGHYGDGLFDDELMAHLPEHSIELEVVFLQYLYEGKRDIRIVPLVVGSFHDCVLTDSSPASRSDIRRMVEALQAAERATPEPVCYLISGDLAHVGPKFGDRRAVTDAQLAHSRTQDHALLRRAERGDFAGYFEVVADEHDRRRICGLPPTWTVLAATRPAGGKVLHYEQYVHPRGFESVSFASVAFYREQG